MPGLFPLSQINLGGVPAIAPAPIIGNTILLADLLITHAMQISGGNFRIVAGQAGRILVPIQWWIQKPSTWAAGYAPTNTTFNLRYGVLATNIGAGLTPTVTNTNPRIDFGNVPAALNLGGVTPYSSVVGQDLIVNCGAGNAGGNANNAPMRATVAYYSIGGLQTAP